MGNGAYRHLFSGKASSSRSLNGDVLGCQEFNRGARLHRRQLLTAGSLSALGLGLGGVPFAYGQEAMRGISQTHAPKAKRCIFLFMWGGPSQLDTFDLKPDAPAEIRGEFKPISTAVPGTQICEHFGQLSKWTDRLSIIRSLSHDDTLEVCYRDYNRAAMEFRRSSLCRGKLCIRLHLGAKHLVSMEGGWVKATMGFYCKVIRTIRSGGHKVYRYLRR